MHGGSLSSAPRAGRGCRQAFCSVAAPRPRHGILSCWASAVLDKAAKTAGPTCVELPPSLRNNVVFLEAPNPTAPGGTTRVYLLAMSHVSKRSVEQVSDLIHLVKPDVVAVELCKERAELLVDPQDAAKPPKIWHSRKVQVEGLPVDESDIWPSEETLLSLLVCKPGRPVTQQDIERDVLRLLSTGLFSSVRPGASNAGRDEAPEFLVRPQSERTDGGGGGGGAAGRSLALVPPLGCIRFKVQARSLPAVTAMSVRVDSSLRAVDVDQPALSAICLQASDEGKKGASGMTTLLRTRQRVMQLLSGYKVAVSFSGVDTGRVEMIVKAVKGMDPPFMSGLEGTAVNGEGFGIEPFRPQRGLFKVSNKMFIPQETIDTMRSEKLGTAAAAAAAQAEGNADSMAAAGDSSTSAVLLPSTGSGSSCVHPRVRASLRPWSPEELAAAKQDEPPRRVVQDTLAQLMSTIYARIQSKAGRTVGLEPGAAWRAALEAATSVGCGTVLLADRPANVTQHSMGAGLAADTGLRLIGSAALTLGSLVVTLGTSLLPDQADGGVLAAGLAAAVAVVAPVVGPFIEVSRFADMNEDQIEEAVAVREPLDRGDLSKPLKLFGEDALLDWPGAFQALIPERDAFMAKAIAAVATGKPGVAPAYVFDEVDGKAVWRYAMPEDGPQRSAPQGLGDGALMGLRGVSAVVGVVGSAHVRGMVRDWPEALQNDDVSPLLADAD
ncbi:hypothetical protein Vretimale_14392 [Volvox reticuliferus]|uniref:Uncharacterized protein n=1 Tax=Volvox reticuliferus TaxID=1737510 RepID=A0A8J4CL50_9CHLO|nr:hypothetical protein Vretifemale_13105 [Volvox reticuliferus]GIM11032.1 hypothetical protein Vretimale_14392 [Volvox reticuliferus]